MRMLRPEPARAEFETESNKYGPDEKQPLSVSTGSGCFINTELICGQLPTFQEHTSEMAQALSTEDKKPTQNPGRAGFELERKNNGAQPRKQALLRRACF